MMAITNTIKHTAFIIFLDNDYESLPGSARSDPLHTFVVIDRRRRVPSSCWGGAPPNRLHAS